MCGIAGFSGRFDLRLLERMADAIAHRGPDDAGVWSDAAEEIGLCHRRLSIIDLSPAGHQPMWDGQQRAVISYNGELYNYRELRRELESDGFSFRGHSDTEVLLNLYLRDGSDMLQRLNGIFAFAIWDPRSQELLLARDQLGVKPLYVSEIPDGFLFGSELKALLQSPKVPRDLDPHALHSHLVFNYCPAPRTMLRAVRKLEPGCALRVRHGRVEGRWRYYDLPYDQPIEPLTEAAAVQSLREHLERAVTRQMVSDVPVGAFLSGGLDSTAIVAFARRQVQDLPCFTIGFRDPAARREGMGIDLPYAERAARHLGVDLHTIWVGPEMTEELPRMIYHLDEPQADPAPINAMYISRLARENGIKVLLSGAGGDDLFTGYRRHTALLQERTWRWLPRSARRAVRLATGALPRTNELSRRVAKAFSYADRDGDRRIASYFYWLDPDRALAILHPSLRHSIEAEAAPEPMVTALSALPETVHPLNRMLYLEGRYFLADHNLNYTDKASMAHGVEVRVPFLDPELVGLAARLPPALKQRGAVGKWIFKRAMEPDLPRDLIYRRKAGFGAPLRHWLRHPLRPLVDDVISEDSLAKRGLFDPAAVRELVGQDRAGRIDATYAIFGMVCVELWCRMFIDGSAPRLLRAS